MTLVYALIATLIVSLISFSGVFFLFLKKDLLNKVLLWLVAFSAGALLGGAFLHLIPKGLAQGDTNTFLLFVIGGFCLFFVMENLLHWHHCHKHIEGQTQTKGHCSVKSLGYMNLLGDGLHNFIDGLIIASAFVIDFNLGIITTLGVVFHEIPQEVSDFGVLVYSGFKEKKALLFNFFSALLALLGAVIGYFVTTYINNVSFFLLAITAGGFLYISASDLIPELHKKDKTKQYLNSFAFFILGLAFMYAIKIISG